MGQLSAGTQLFPLQRNTAPRAQLNGLIVETASGETLSFVRIHQLSRARREKELAEHTQPRDLIGNKERKGGGGEG